MPPKRSIDRIAAILDDIGESGKLDDHFGVPLQDDRLKVEHLPITLVYPDPAQPRRVLPETIYTAFYQHRLTPVQALREFIQMVGVVARQKGRPFTNILDLLPNSNEDASDTEPEDFKPTPEETLLRELVTLAVTIRDDGQVNPLTVVDRSEGVTQLFKIETGERRYWATWVMMEFLPGYQGDGTLPCIIVLNQTASVFRQAKENTSRTGLNAIALARQAALLILHVHGIEPPEDGPVPNDFYRQALDLDLQGKREYTCDILTAMGGISRVHFSRLKGLLKLSDEALELADRYSIDEFRLRPSLSLEPEYHLQVVRQIIDFNLSARQVQELCEEPTEQDSPEPLAKPSRHAVQFARSVLKSDKKGVEEVVYAMLTEENDHRIIKMRWQDFVSQVEALLENL